MKDTRKKNVVDEEGNIIGQESRETIHSKGLLHQEIHVWFFTPRNEIIFQRRSEKADTFPNLLDATVGGHVEIGDSYEKAALREIEEETGVKVKKEDLIFIKMLRSNRSDPITHKINNVIRAVYAVFYDKGVQALEIEEGHAIGFEAWPIDDLLVLSEADKKQFIETIVSEEGLNIFRNIQETIYENF